MLSLKSYSDVYTHKQSLFSSVSSTPFTLRSDTFGITGEPCRFTNVGQAQKEHDDTFQPNTSPTMGLRAMTEGIDVGFNILQVNTPCLGALLQHFGFMNTLCATQDFLAANEEIIGVGELGVGGVWHRVERANGEWVLVHEEKVGSVLLLDNVAELLFVQGTQILIIILQKRNGVQFRCKTFGSGWTILGGNVPLTIIIIGS